MPHDRQHLFIGNRDQGIHVLLQVLDTMHGQVHALLPLEREGLRHHCDREGPLLPGQFGYDRRGPGSGSATHARGDENHVGTVDGIGNPVPVLHGRLAADFGIGARPESLGQVFTQLQDGRCIGARQHLRVGIGVDEIDAIQIRSQHVFDGVTAATANADDLDHRLLAYRLNQFKHF